MTVAEIRKILAKVNWPSAVVVIAGLIFYALVLAPDYVTHEEMSAEFGKHHPELDIQVRVHGTGIETLNMLHTQQAEDIRELRRRGP